MHRRLQGAELRKSRRHLLRLGSALFASALALSLPAAPSAADDTITIGIINPFSGPLALYGDECARGYELAAAKLNAEGGVLGQKIEFLRGDASNPQQGIAAVDELMTQADIDLFIGTYMSSVSNTASDAAMRHERLYFDTHALATELTLRGLPNFVRAGPNALHFAQVSVDTVENLLAPALEKPMSELTVWLEHEESIYGTSIAERQKELLEELGATVVGVSPHQVKAIDMTDTILRAMEADPDVWMQTGYPPDTSLLLKTAREQGFSPKAIVLSGTGDTPDTRDAVGVDGIEGVFVVGYPRYDQSESYGPGTAEFLAAYREAYGSDPIGTQSMEAYAGLLILADVIEAAGSTDLEAMQEAVAAIDMPLKSYPTGFGAKFDENRQNTRALPTTGQWQNGQVVTVYPAEAAQPGTELTNLPRE